MFFNTRITYCTLYGAGGGGGGGGITEEIWAEHDAVVPPLVPRHCQVHGPVPDTVVAVPAEQRLLVGLDATVLPFADPQTPFTTVGEEVTDTMTLRVTLPPVPVHASRYVVVTVGDTVTVPEVLLEPLEGDMIQDVAPDELQVSRDVCPEVIDVGLAEKVAVGAEALWSRAVHDAFEPPLEPAHCQVHGPLPDTVEAVPTEQRLLVGREV